MARRIQGILKVILALVLLLSLLGLWAFRDVLFVQQRSFEQVRQLLLPHLKIMQPASSGRHPAILFFHGCGGLHESRSIRAQAAVDRGFVAILVDSYTGRNIDWERTCNGVQLPGFQRAADVFVALDIARKLPSVDPQQLFLVGYSHGAWTILEALALGDQLPWGLSDSPGHNLDGVRGLVAWYPYCGLGAQYTHELRTDIPVLMLMAAQDHTTPAEPCIHFAQLEQAGGQPVTWRLYPGVDHGFDLQEDWVRVYDPRVHASAMAEQMDFLELHRSPALL